MTSIKLQNTKKKKKIIEVPAYEFDILDESYSVSNIQDYLKYILKKHAKVTNNLSIMIQVNKLENRTTFIINKGYYIELLTPETMKLLGNSAKKINKDENGKYISHFEINEVVLICFYIQ